MKKLMILLVVLALLITFPAAAGAKKPPPGQEPFPGETCAERRFDDPSLWLLDVFPVTDPEDPANIVDCSEPDDPCFSLTLEGDERAACIDVSSLEGVWNFEIEAAGVASFTMQIKDSVPGDVCWRDAWSRTKMTDLPESLTTPSVVPAATSNACPGDDFTDGAEPLVFMVGYTPERKSNDFGVTITVDLP